MNVVKEIRRYNAGRDPVRLALKYAHMRADAFTFLRATCHLFHARLPEASVLRKAPPAWACGDLHLENFGTYKGDNGQVYFDINDFDEALLAPASLDLVRLLASLHVGRQALGLGSAATAADELAGVLLDAWAATIAGGKARWVERETAPAPVGPLIEAVRARSRVEFLDSRTERRGRQRVIRVDGRKALAATDAERTLVTGFLAAFAAAQPEPRFYDVVDVARRIAGNGSLGLPRFIVMVRGKGGPDRYRLLDLKAARPSAAAPHVALAQPVFADEAVRIATLQQRMQAIAMAFLHPVRVGGEPFVLRALQPSEDRVAFGGRGPGRTQRHALVVLMAECLAWAQLRASGRGGAATADTLIDWAAGARWRRKLLALAHEAAAQVEADWRSYADAYDDGAFAVE